MNGTETIDQTKYVVKFKRVVYDVDLAVKIKLSHIGKLAKSVGVSRQYISGIIRGEYVISEELYLKIKEQL